MSTPHHNVKNEPEGESRFVNRPAPDAPYFTPLQSPPAGTALVPEGKTPASLPRVFQPLRIRGLLLQNRIMLSPLCQYSAADGHATAWHMAHMGGIVMRGPGLACIEATGVTPDGRITPQCLGLWKDSQIAPLRQLVDFAHSQGQKMIIQLGHSGRKGSTVAPWLSSARLATPDQGGWADRVAGPSPIAWDDRHATPREMTLDDIAAVRAAFAAAVRRAVAAAFDAIELHSAHGYLLHSFLSPASNRRTDAYGGSFDKRARLLLEVVADARAAIPPDMPLFVRLSGSDCLEARPDLPSWTADDTARLAPLLADAGVDLVDVSAGGNHPAQAIEEGPAYQAPFAKAAKRAVGDRMLVSTVGEISSAAIAEAQLADGLDMVSVGTGFLKDPSLVWSWADQLGVHVRLPNQIRWAFEGRGDRAARPIVDVLDEEGTLQQFPVGFKLRN